MDSPTKPPNRWTLLVYRLPALPSRLRITVWRRLQALGAEYLQDGVAVLPARDDLIENLGYIATAIRDSNGTAILLAAQGSGGSDDAAIVARFRGSADARMQDIAARLDAIAGADSDPAKRDLDVARERLAYLKARRISYFGSDLEDDVARQIEAAADRIGGLK